MLALVPIECLDLLVLHHELDFLCQEGPDLLGRIDLDLFLEGQVDLICNGQREDVQEVGETVVDRPRIKDKRSTQGVN
jgi:hypothetical protein